MTNNPSANLTAIVDDIRDGFTARSAARDDAIARSRELIRHCSESIRAVHRHDWPTADAKLLVVREKADEIAVVVQSYPDLYHAGYTQDALKEVAEAFITYAIIRNEPLATPPPACPGPPLPALQCYPDGIAAPTRSEERRGGKKSR